MFFPELLFDGLAERFEPIGEYRESGGLAVPSECDEVFAAFLQELDDTDVLRAPTARDELVFLALEGDRRLSEGFRQASGDESDDAVLDIGRVIEEDSLIPIHDFECMLHEMFGRGFSFRIQVLEFREDRVEFVFSCEQERERFVWTIHTSCRIDTRADVEPDDIRVQRTSEKLVF